MQIGILKIKKLVDALIEFVRLDYESNSTTPEESFIERCFDSDDYDGNINYLDQAKSIFLRTVESSRKLDTRIMFDPDRAMLPTIHVREPAKGPGPYDGIGNMGEDFYSNEDGSVQHSRRRTFYSEFELMITSANRHEVIIIEEVMVALLMSLQDTIIFNMPFSTIQVSVKELVANSDNVPQPMFIKAITLKMSYEKTYPDVTEIVPVLSIIFNKTLLKS